MDKTNRLKCEKNRTYFETNKTAPICIPHNKNISGWMSRSVVHYILKHVAIFIAQRRDNSPLHRIRIPHIPENKNTLLNRK